MVWFLSKYHTININNFNIDLQKVHLFLYSSKNTVTLQSKFDIQCKLTSAFQYEIEYN